MPRSFDRDETIRLVRPPPRFAARLLIPLLACLAGVSVSVPVAWLLLRPAAPVLPAAAPPVPGFPLADEAAILAAPAPNLLVFRFRDAPAVLVLSFPSLSQQGEMFNRVAAFVEKAGLPRDRLLADAELDAAIRQAGDTRESYYYGHDYSAADLARFFTTAERDGVALNPEELRLRTMLQAAGLLTLGATGAVITVPPASAADQIDAAARATILHHELSHGAFFTDPAYAAYARDFWQSSLTETQRDAFRHFLSTEGYDTANEELMLNEAQAFLVHTNDARYFRPDRAGLTQEDASMLRDSFIRGMPPGWLKTAAQQGRAGIRQ